MMISKKEAQKNRRYTVTKREKKFDEQEEKRSSRSVNFVAFLFVSFNRIESPRERERKGKKNIVREEGGKKPGNS